MTVKPRILSGTLTSVASSATSVALFATNGVASGRTIFNDSVANLYVAFTATAASTSAYTVKIAPAGYYEFPGADGGSGAYNGAVTGIWDSATGNARLTEW